MDQLLGGIGRWRAPIVLRVWGRLRVTLREHVHTLRCDRRERVCTAVGAVREFEWLRLEGHDGAVGGFWVRRAPGASDFAKIDNSDNLVEYQMTSRDVGASLAFQVRGKTRNAFSVITLISASKLANIYAIEWRRDVIPGVPQAVGPDGTAQQVGPVMGLVEPAPPKAHDLRIEGDFKNGGVIRACYNYEGELRQL
jgi:hypothetical protein